MSQKTKTCPNCATEIPESDMRCSVCGWTPYIRVRLSGSVSETSFGVKTSVGRPLVKNLCGEDDARYADYAKQFVLSFDEEGAWWVIPGEGKNPTFLNGRELRSEKAIKTGDVISIGSRRALMTVKID